MTERAHITLNRAQWRDLHNALCAAEREASGLFAVLKDGGEGLAALKSVRDALAPAYAQDLYDETDEGSFDQPHPYTGATHIVHAMHWGTDGNVEVPIAGDTWLDIYRAANEAIQASGDNHHIFVERFDPVPDKQGYLSLVTGS